jgi:hypothetical protein
VLSLRYRGVAQKSRRERDEATAIFDSGVLVDMASSAVSTSLAIWWSAMPIKALSPNGTSVQRVLREGGVTY